MSAARWFLICALSMFVVTCGNKGPLTLPEGDAREAEIGAGR